MVIKYKLDNGLVVILEPIDSVVSISAGLWVKVGSRHENADQSGYAHFLEHMMFKGTEKYSAKDIARIVDRVGGQHNAATNREYTCYYINVISDYLDLSIELLSDMYHRSLFDAEEIGKEKNVIIEEIRMYEDTPDELVHDVFMECMMSDHPLGHSILGSVDSIKNAGRENLIDFLDEFYTDSNCIFVIAGKFDPDEANSLISKYFPDPSRPMSVKSFSENSRSRIYRKHVERNLEQIHFCLGTEGLNKVDDDRWALFALSTILGGSMSSRLFQNIREKEGLCYSVYSFHSSYADTGVFGVYCGSSPENYRRALDLILKECGTLLRNGVSEQELDEAKAFMKGNLALSLESTEVRMSQLARSEMAYGRYYGFDEIVEQINRVTLDDFSRVCRKLFGAGKMTLVSIGKLGSQADEIVSL
jgi:predicted Zn-dependent peptidase